MVRTKTPKGASPGCQQIQCLLRNTLKFAGSLMQASSCWEHNPDHVGEVLIAQAAEVFVQITVWGHLLGYANPFGSELFTFSPAREGSCKCQRYRRLSCASQGAACRTHELWSSLQSSCRLPSLPVSSFFLLLVLGTASASGVAEQRRCGVGLQWALLACDAGVGVCFPQ